MAIQTGQDSGGKTKPSKRTTHYYGGNSYGTGDQAGSTKRPSYKLKYKPAKTPKPGTKTTDQYYQGSSGYGTGSQAGFSGTKKDKPKVDKPKPTRDPNRVAHYWGTGDSGYGSGPNKGTGGKPAQTDGAKPVRRGVDKGSRYEKDAGVGGGKRTWNSLGPAAQRRLTAQRERRNAKGDFKGKYYGPDELRGNISALQRWRDAGSPKDISKYIPNRSGKKSDSYLKSGKK